MKKISEKKVTMWIHVNLLCFQAFFRRAVTDKNKYACLKDNNCSITAQKRGNCSACRLQKCFDLGMSKGGKFERSLFLYRVSNEREIIRHQLKFTTSISITKSLDKFLWILMRKMHFLFVMCIFHLSSVQFAYELL